VSRTFKLFAVFAMVLMVPLRAFAAVTLGGCAQDEPQAAQAHEHDGHGSAHGHEPAPKPQGHGHHQCNACAEHCASASVVAQAFAIQPTARPGGERFSFGERFIAGFIPEHLDPPPLAS
jgi:hypothetical protein